MCAGFNDSHMHLLNMEMPLAQLSLSQHTQSLSGMRREYMKEFIREQSPKPGTWVREEDGTTITLRMKAVSQPP